MFRGQLGSVFCIVVITVCLTSIFFLLSDIGRYFDVIEIMIMRIFYSIKVILILSVIMFLALLFLLKR